MKKHIYLLALLAIVLATGCSDPLLDEEAPEHIAAASQSAGVTRSDAILYHEATSTWMRPIVDPYRLEHMQRACDNLAAAEAASTLSGVQRKRFAATRLASTHYHVRIYPKTEEEQWELEQDKDITVGYIPFDYAGLPLSELSGRQAVAAENVYPDERRYTITHEGYMTVHGPAPTETIVLPALYAVWPCTKPFPQDMDYEILYDVFLPEAAAATAARSRMSCDAPLDTEQLDLLEQEALALVFGRQKAVIPPPVNISFTGKITQLDKFLHREVPLANLQIRFQYGSNTMTTYTRDDGSFTILFKNSPVNTLFSCVFINDKWKITEEDSTKPITVINRIEDVDQCNFSLDFLTSPFVEIHRAVNFFYNGSHTVPKWYYEAGMRLIACPYEKKDVSGEFYYFNNKAAYIKIYTANKSDPQYKIPAVFHEMGHFIQYSMQGFGKFHLSRNLLIESYASYVGWYLGKRYYSTLGYTDKDHNPQGRQDWTKTQEKYADYSPLFVDLVDEYDQSLVDYRYNKDEIKNIPASVIDRLARECTTWWEYERVLTEYAGVYFSAEEMNDYLAPYRYFLNRRS